MSLIADLSTVTSHPDGIFLLALPDTEEEGFPSFSSSYTVVAQQNADSTVTLSAIPKLTTFPRWQPNQLNSHSFSWYSSPETLSLHQLTLIPPA